MKYERMFPSSSLEPPPTYNNNNRNSHHRHLYEEQLTVKQTTIKKPLLSFIKKKLRKSNKNLYELQVLLTSILIKIFK